MLKRTLPLFVAAILMGCGGASEEHAEGEHAEVQLEEVSAIVAELQESQADFRSMMEGLSEAQWNHQESEDRWSIAGVAEHLIVSESTFGGMIRDSVLTAEMSEASASADSVDQIIVTSLLDRSQTFQAPPFAQPTGAYATPEEAIAAFDEARNANIAMAQEAGDMLRYHRKTHPIGFDMDAEQWFLFMSSHTRRHLAQAQQVKDHEGYPAS